MYVGINVSAELESLMHGMNESWYVVKYAMTRDTPRQMMVEEPCGCGRGIDLWMLATSYKLGKQPLFHIQHKIKKSKRSIENVPEPT